MMSTPKLSRGAKVISWFAMVNGTLCLASPFLLGFLAKVPVNLDAATIYFISAGVSITAGFFGLRRQQWAFWLLCLLFVLQVVEYKSEQTVFSLVGPVSLKVGLFWANPPAAINFNLFAMIMVGLAGTAALRIMEQDKKVALASVPNEA
jgi:hypothetical protein